MEDAKDGGCNMELFARSEKLKKTRLGNPIKKRSLEVLGALDKLGLEGLLLFMYPNFIL